MSKPLPYTCDVKGAQNDITMNWDGKQFVIDEIETSETGKKISVARSLVRHHSHLICSDRGIWGPRRTQEATVHDTSHQSRNGAQHDNIDAASSGDHPSRAADPAPELQNLKKRSPVTGPQLMTLCAAFEEPASCDTALLINCWHPTFSLQAWRRANSIPIGAVGTN